jgi:leader peptidase (prepilin peptidase)/N-methyltransferase
VLAAVRRVPAGEALCAVGLLVVAALALGPRPGLLGVGWLAVVTPRLVDVDLARHRLPDAVVLPGYPVVLLALLLDDVLTGTDAPDAVAAGAGCGLAFLLLHAAGGLGFGDVKLAPLLGALAALVLPGGAVLWLVVTFLLGGCAAIGVLVRRGLGARMPFGPPMLAAAWLVVALA